MEFYEFFAGGGMARLGLGGSWNCLFANDIDEMKAECYRLNFKETLLPVVRDIKRLKVSDLPGHADLAWASFPCQDLSLAGNGEGLKGRRSGLFWEFWRLVRSLRLDGRAPRTLVLENVYGTVTSHGGRDMAAICDALAAVGYRFAPVVVDASLFLPQSRPRLFIIGFDAKLSPPSELLCFGPEAPWHPDAFEAPYDLLAPESRNAWTWIRLPVPARKSISLNHIIESEPAGVEWHTAFETKRLLSMMTPINRAKVRAAKLMGRRIVGTVYRRTRPNALGERVQRAEVRFDDIAGCLRTPSGGSSRQTVLIVDGERVSSRLLSPREAARLMGIPDWYVLPRRYNDAYHLAGDGVAVPVVKHLSSNLLEPLLTKMASQSVNAA
jgi:DNA (cytosine-5)-methyltransferase 1